MIEKSDDFFENFDVSCDCCSFDQEYLDVDSFDDLIDQMKQDGWRIIYVDGEFKHKCPLCAHQK